MDCAPWGDDDGSRSRWSTACDEVASFAYRQAQRNMRDMKAGEGLMIISMLEGIRNVIPLYKAFLRATNNYVPEIVDGAATPGAHHALPAPSADAADGDILIAIVLRLFSPSFLFYFIRVGNWQGGPHVRVCRD